jgi:predicted PurR-regulated permease PerM
MTIELILIILLCLFVGILLGVALHLARTIEQMRQYITELERDYSNAVGALQGSALPNQPRDHDTAADHQ